MTRERREDSRCNESALDDKRASTNLRDMPKERMKADRTAMLEQLTAQREKEQERYDALVKEYRGVFDVLADVCDILEL